MQDPDRSRSNGSTAPAGLDDALIEVLPHGVVVYRLDDPDDPGSLRLVRANDAASHAIGFDAKAELGRTFREALPQVLETEIPSAYAEVARSGEARDLGLVEYGDERVRPATFRVRALPLPERHVAVVFQNVTAQAESEARLRLLTSALENARDAVLITGPDLDEPGPEIVYANAAFERLTGYAPDEVEGRSPRFLQGPDTDRAVLDRLRATLERGETFHGEAVNYRKDGTPFVMEWEIAPIRHGGAVTHWVATQRDVSERRRQALRFRGVFDSAFQLTFVVRPDGTLVEVNRTALEFASVRAGEVVGVPVWEGPWWGISEGTRAELREAVERAASGALARYVVDIAGAGDAVATLDLTVKPVQAQSGAVELLVIEGRDITEDVRTQRELRDVQRMQERLRAEEARYRSLVRAAAAIVWTVSPGGGLGEGNESWAAFTGQSREEAAGEGWLDVIHPDDRVATLDAWGRALKSGGLFEIEHRLRRHDGVYRHMLVRGVPVLDEDGRLKEWVGTHTDIHDRKRAEVRAHFLAGAGTLLTGGLDHHRTLREVARLAVPAFADWCAVKLVEDGEVRDIAVAHVDPEKVRWAEELQHRFSDAPDAPTGLPNVLRTGEAELYTHVPEDLLVAAAQSEDHLEVIRQVGFRSAIIVPLRTEDGVLGAITFVTSESGRHFDEGDLDVAKELGRRAGTAIENARLHQALRESESRYRFLSETIQQQIWTAEPDGLLDYGNQFMVEYYGLPLDGFTGERWGDVVHPEDLPAAAEGWARAIETGDPYEVEFRLRRADGSYRWHIGRATAFRDDDGHIAKWFGTNTDIHEKKEAEHVLAEANRTLEGRVAERTRDLATFTNDLKALHRVTTAEHEDLDAFLRDFIRTGCDIFEMPVGILSETPYDEATGSYRYRVLIAESTVPSMPVGWEAPLSDSYCEVVMEREGTVFYADAADEDEAVRSKPTYAEYGLRSFIGTPIWVGQEVFGTLKFASPEPRVGGFASHERELIEILAEHIGRLLSAQRAEAQRAETDARYRSVVQTVHEGLVLVDADGAVLMSNPAAREFLGLEEGTFVAGSGKGASRRVVDTHGRPVSEHELPEQVVMRTGKPVRSVVQGIAGPDGNLRWYSVNARAVGSTDERRSTGERAAGAVVLSFSDITEQRQAEAELRASEEQLRKAQEIARVGSWRWDVAADEITWSDELYRIFGLRPGDFEPTFEHYLRLLHPEDREQVQRAVQAAVDRQEPYEVRHRITRHDGEVRHVFSLGEVVVNAAGETVALQGTAQDVTEQRQAEQDLRHYADALEERNAELEQFAYVASHDLQEPLRMVSSFLQLLQRRYEGALDATADEYIAYAVDGAKRMQVLIQDLLAYSRVGTRGKPFEPVDMNRAAETVLTDLGPALEEYDADVTVDPLPTIRADESQMRQLLQNLIGNAVKFHGEEPPEVRVGAERWSDGGEGGWRFSVTDNGIGVAAEHAERIFQIFQRLHTRDEYEGTGIGLAMCKKIVERHGGRIWLESEFGHGAAFHFWMPDRPPEEQVARPRAVGGE